MKNLLILSAIILFVACSAKKAVIMTQPQLDLIQTSYPGTTLTDLQRGQNLHNEHCGNCHGTKNPANYSSEKWTEHVARMVKKVNKQEQVLDAQGQEDITRYGVAVILGAGK